MPKKRDRQSMVNAIRDLLLGSFHVKFDPIQETDSETVLRMQEPASKLRYEVRITAVE
jgi:hypothetical protein